MTLKFFNTLTKKKEIFKPIKEGHVGMYTCGPTIYDFAHIGNFRAYVFEDILRRYLKYKGYEVKQIMNLTDVDDKTMKGSIANNVSLKEYTAKYEKAFFEDMVVLNIEKAEVYPAATDHITEMVGLIKKLLKEGYAYKSEDGSYYYDISKFKNYGKLAHLKLDELKVGARVKQDEYEKERANDFALWKAWDENDGDVFWETELGKGRPGWHIECSAMSMKYLGETFDIHTGGVDNMFPHHENEIAQSEAATGRKFVHYWMHCEHLQVDGKKMSKSLGNFYTLRDILAKGYDPKSIRYVLLSTHYRQKLNFTFAGLDAAKNSVNRLLDFMINLKEYKGHIHNSEVEKIAVKTQKAFEEAMDDDLNMSEALAAIFELVKEVNILLADAKMDKKDAGTILGVMQEFDKVLGLLEYMEEDIPAGVLELVKERETARKKKDFNKSDCLRQKIADLGYSVDDTRDGTRVKRRS